MKNDIKRTVQERIRQVGLQKSQYDVNIKTSAANSQHLAQAKAEGGLWAVEEELNFLEGLLKSIEANEVDDKNEK